LFRHVEDVEVVLVVVVVVAVAAIVGGSRRPSRDVPLMSTSTIDETIWVKNVDCRPLS
jgi:hypothetical protein